MLNQLLKNLGFNPSATAPTRTTYKSPFNPSEKTASFFVFPNQKWNGQEPLREFNYKCNSTGHGGNIFDFVMKYYNLDFKSAKNKTNELLGAGHQEQNYQQKTAPSFSSNQPKEKSIKIKKTQSLKNKALFDYLSDRKISTENAKRYLGEIYYQIGNKNYFAISFSNDTGGREIRNKFFKGSLGKKGITFIRPTAEKKVLKIFEGFMDFLSYLEMAQNSNISHYLILNSASLVQRALEAIGGDYELIELYLDNDKRGDEATLFFINNISHCEIRDKRNFYKDFKDINEMLLAK